MLLRHAEAERASAPATDFERRLTERGELDARETGAGLRRSNLEPALILTSPALRARRSAELVADACALSHAVIELQPSLYLATAGTILAAVAAARDSCACLLVVGHNPGLSAVVQRLAPTFALDSLPTAAVVAVAAQCRSWADVGSADWAVRYYDSPAMKPPLTG